MSAPKNSRSAVIERTSLLGIIANLLIAGVKIILGLAGSSLAVISEGINNASDAASSGLTLIGARLSQKHPDEKHPFGYGRIEYLTSLVIGGLILYAGISLAAESVQGILHPERPEVSLLMIAAVAISAVAKFFLGRYTEAKGKEVDSSALIAVGEDSRNDSFFSLITIAVSVITLLGGPSLDAFAGLIFSGIVLKAGFETLRGTVSELLGEAGQEELARAIYKEIRKTPCVVNAADMMLHNYGPDNYSGSVNLEIDHKLSVGELYAEIHALQLRIMHEHHVTMVFGIYAVDNDGERIRELRRRLAEFVRTHEHVTSYHALYLEPETGRIYCDLVVDYALQDWDALREEFLAFMAETEPGHEIMLTIETEYV